MKKLFLLAGFASVFSVSLFAKSIESESGVGLEGGTGVECPSGCYGGNIKCCTTKGGSTYFTRS